MIDSTTVTRRGETDASLSLVSVLGNELCATNGCASTGVSTLHTTGVLVLVNIVGEEAHSCAREAIAGVALAEGTVVEVEQACKIVRKRYKLARKY